MKIFIVTGTFDRSGGKPSFLGQKFIENFWSNSELNAINGGSLTELELMFNKDHFAYKNITDQDVILWMPNIDNSEDKFLPKIKKINPKALLISSKRCIENKYSEQDVIGHLLKNKSNLGIMITKKKGEYNFQLLDPLGNEYCNTPYPSFLCDALVKRVQFIQSLHRMPSKKHDDEYDFEIEPAFIEVVKKYGNIFSKHVNAVNPNRFLGNASTRCSYGFPGTRNNGRIFISRRNIDKKNISSKDFVEVDLKKNSEAVFYRGENKPSVDAPIQLMLFDYYKNIKYIIHGHVYAKVNLSMLICDKSFEPHKTHQKIPCGYIEEFQEITKLLPSPETKDVCINLKGHGCLIMSETLEFFNKIILYSRSFPEKDSYEF